MGEIRVVLRLVNVDEDDDDPKAVSLFLMESKAVELEYHSHIATAPTLTTLFWGVSRVGFNLKTKEESNKKGFDFCLSVRDTLAKYTCGM